MCSEDVDAVASGNVRFRQQARASRFDQGRRIVEECDVGLKENRAMRPVSCAKRKTPSADRRTRGGGEKQYQYRVATRAT